MSKEGLKEFEGEEGVPLKVTWIRMGTRLKFSRARRSDWDR